MKHLFFILLIITSTCGLATANQVEVVSEHWPPFIVHQKGLAHQSTHKVTGQVTRNVREILHLAELDYSLTIYPWARSFHLATNKPNVLIYSIFKNEQRAPKFHWFCPIYPSTPIKAYKLANNDADVHSLEALKSAVVGVMRGDNSYKYLLDKGFEEDTHLDVSANEEINLLKLITGKIDVVIQSEQALRYRLKQLNASHLTIVEGLTLHPIKQTEHCMALSQGTDEKIIDKIDKAFKQWLVAQNS
ncbi:substrate-binding periplasmic protein [Thalassotalea euphylliae]|uniref:Uncharacterized protein n=1 Tax=Thalassotalea euphylliae TaxID=1655234 RepID=A0A3E0U1U5_9GAMM|nr:transporter substrate-binding domain-containing protein [Thalassotalea euphylliae]REL30689.1 hypothetical protein DXX94_08160 [Thalassotalea euphylliae]